MVLELKKGASKAEMEELVNRLGKLPLRKKKKARKYIGVIRLREDALAIQKKLRDEWE